MSDYQNISIDLLSNVSWLVALALAALIALAALAYWRTNPPVSGWLRFLLYFLRLAAVSALCVALFEPVLSFDRQSERSPRLAVLIDRSASMDREENNLTRSARTDSLLSSAEFEERLKTVDVTRHFFGGNLTEASGDVTKDRTALGEALHNLRQSELSEPSDYWLLLTDGNSNSGREPEAAVRGTTAPILAVDLALGGGQFDVVLKDIDFNPVLFAGEETEIKVKFGWENARQTNLLFQLNDAGRLVTSQRMVVDQANGLGEVILKYTPQEPGQHLLQLSIPQLDGEENIDNNSRSFSVKVLKSKLLVLITTEAPDYEVGFLRRFLDQADKYEVELVVQSDKAGNLGARFPTRQTELNRYDLVVFHDPDPTRYINQREILKSFLTEKGGAVWVLMGERFAARGPVDWFDDLLPFSQSRKTPARFMEFHGAPVEAQLFHPAVRLAEDQSAIRSAWADLSPFQVLVECDRLDANAQILVQLSSGDPDSRRVPLMGFKRHGPGKLYATSALPLWTWSFADIGFGGDGGLYNRYLESLIGWLTVRDDLDPVRILPRKKVFSRGESVGFDGFAFDQGYRPIPGVNGTVTIVSPEGTSFETDLLEQEPGKYVAEFTNLEPGQYSFRGIFDKEGKLLTDDNGEIVVEKFSLEEFDQSGNPALLTALARASGGGYFTSGQFVQALERIPTDKIVVDESGEIVIWNKIWLLLTIILALSLEWLVRKMNQLI